MDNSPDTPAHFPLPSPGTDCVFVLDAAGLIEAVSAGCCSLMETGEPTELVGRNWPDILLPEWRAPAAEAIQRALAGLPSRFHADALTLKGKLRRFDLNVRPFHDDDRKVMRVLVRKSAVGSTTDGLEHRLREKDEALAALTEQLDLQRRQLAEASLLATHSEKIRVMGQFVGNIVHDINNVLTIVNGASRMLGRGVAPAAQADILARVDRAVERGAELTRQLLDLSRIEGAEPDVVSLADLLGETGKLIALLLGPQIALEIDVDKGCWSVLASPGRLQAVLLNLSANARDAMPDGGSLTVRVGNCHNTGRPPALAPGDYVHIAIADTGSGMSPEVRAKAGHAFFTTKQSGKGTGLGLASAFELARQCRGRVLIESEVGVGTTISLYLPRAAAEGEPVATADDPIDPKLHGNATILLVENEEMIRSHLAAVLRLLEYRVIEAAAEDVAYALRSGGIRIDLACIDLQLDQGSGLGLAGRLREAQPDLPVIFMTGSSAMPKPANALVFRKPIAEGALARAILEKLGRRPASMLTAEALRLSDRLRGKIRNPQIRQAFDRWRSLAGGSERLPPASEAFGFAPGLTGSTCLMRVDADDADAASFRVVSAGAALIERLGRDLTGELIAAADHDLLGSIGSAYRRALRGIVHFDYARFPLGPDSMILFERLILPLSDDGERVSHLLGLITFDDIGVRQQGNDRA
ncbi:ATP-binding protein [Bradyrhizobium sp.]|uniref:ATP-binding protein n=1 Tax=Bradyrhizobium sp. TaxID=376 RepID=UPI003C325B9D